MKRLAPLLTLASAHDGSSCHGARRPALLAHLAHLAHAAALLPMTRQRASRGGLRLRELRRLELTRNRHRAHDDDCRARHGAAC